MGYVMVPVPEEHVQEAMEAVLRIVRRASFTDWDEASFAELFDSVDEAAKSVLSAVARSMATRAQVPDNDVARVIEISQREVLGIVRELNEAAANAAHPQIFTVQMVAENLPNGRTREQRVLSILPAVVDLVKAAEQAEQSAAPHPLAGGTG